MSNDRVVAHLNALIRIPSVSSQSNKPVIEYAMATLDQAGWHSREFKYRDAAGEEKVNLLAAPYSQSLSARDVALAFVCHTDTVPHAVGWHAALSPYEADGFIHGCGACDVKGFLACLLAAIEECDAASLIDGVRLLLTADEEVGCLGATRVLAADLIRPQKIIVGEPTSLHPARAGKGYALAEFIVHGKEAHSALPSNGVSAIYGAARLVAAIEHYAAELATEQNAVFTPPFTTMNVGVIEGGTAKNILAGSCRFLLEWRPIPGQPSSAVFQGVLNLAEGIKAAHPGFAYSARQLRDQSGFETSESSSLVRTVSTMTGKVATSIPFGSEASIFAPMAEEVIVFGPGDMHTAHSDRECVPVAELTIAVGCLKTLMTVPDK